LGQPPEGSQHPVGPFTPPSSYTECSRSDDVEEEEEEEVAVPDE